MTYSYDGDGRRIAKVGSKLYWYGSGGEILSETDASGNVQNEYVYFGGKRLALVPPSGDKLFYIEDLLGSSRLIAKASAICYDADFTPFGGEKAYTNTCSQNYKFEGKERDTETQNDDFGAREYSWRFGRWLSSDWSSTPVAVPYANLSNPQTLNLYAMVNDDPESFADLDGHDPPQTSSATGNGTQGTCAPAADAQCTPQQPPPNTTTAVATGAGKELFNELKNALGAANLVQGLMNGNLSAVQNGISALTTPDLSASNTTEKTAMTVTAVAIALVPIGGEAKGGQILSRFGESAESVARLSKKAAEAEASNVGIHGVSATAARVEGEVSRASRSSVETAFKVHDTPTARDPLHKTIELPKPVTQRIADVFNALFGR